MVESWRDKYPESNEHRPSELVKSLGKKSHGSCSEEAQKVWLELKPMIRGISVRTCPCYGMITSLRSAEAYCVNCGFRDFYKKIYELEKALGVPSSTDLPIIDLSSRTESIENEMVKK
jgi:hypothetical protein